MVIPEGTEYRDGSWITASSDTVWNGGGDSVPVEYYPATYYELVSDNISYTVEDDLGNTLSGSCASPNPAHYEQFERFPSTLVGADIDALAYDGGCLRRHEIRSGNSFPSGRSYDDEMQNFANWFSYSRKRHIATRSGIGESFKTLAGVRTGALTLNSRSLRGMYLMGDPDERSNFFDFIYGLGGNSAGTPNRETLKFMGDQFNNNSSVINQSCQQNFALLFTDGFSNPSTNSRVGNADGDMGEPFADGTATPSPTSPHIFTRRSCAAGPSRRVVCRHRQSVPPTTRRPRLTVTTTCTWSLMASRWGRRAIFWRHTRDGPGCPRQPAGLA